MKIKAIVFDFDGVLVDSNSLKRDSFHKLDDLDNSAKEVLKEVLSLHILDTRFEIFRKVFSRLGKSPEEIESLVHKYSEMYNHRVQQGILDMGLIGGALETLKLLSGKYNLYLNSATPERALMESAEKLGIWNLFKAVYGRDYSAGADLKKTKEENLKKIMAAEGIDGSRIVFIGDGDGDRQAAESQNCFFIGIANDSNSWQNTDFILVDNVNLALPIIDSLG